MEKLNFLDFQNLARNKVDDLLISLNGGLLKTLKTYPWPTENNKLQRQERYFWSQYCNLSANYNFGRLAICLALAEENDCPALELVEFTEPYQQKLTTNERLVINHFQQSEPKLALLIDGQLFLPAYPQSLEVGISNFHRLPAWPTLFACYLGLLSCLEHNQQASLNLAQQAWQNSPDCAFTQKALLKSYRLNQQNTEAIKLGEALIAQDASRELLIIMNDLTDKIEYITALDHSLACCWTPTTI